MKEVSIKNNFGYCFSCENLQEFNIVEVKENIRVKDISVVATQYKCICNKCGELVVNEEIEELNDHLLYDEYKLKQGLMLPKEIKSLRESYGLSQVNLAKLLNFGEKSITRYENGSIQDETHDLMLKLIKSKEIFRSIWEINKFKLDAKSIEKVESKIYKSDCNFIYQNNIQLQTLIGNMNFINLDQRGYVYGC